MPLAVDTRKAVAILALLATDGRAYARDELAALLWPDSRRQRRPVVRSDGRFRPSMPRSGMGRSMSGASGSTLVAAVCRIDLVELERLAASEAPEDLSAAGDLVRGPFLAGFSLRDSVEFDDWRATRAAAVERTIIGVLDRLTVARRGRR